MGLKFNISPKQFLERVSDADGVSSVDSGVKNAAKQPDRTSGKKKLDEKITELEKLINNAYKKGEEYKKTYTFDKMASDTRTDEDLKAQAEQGLNEKYDLKTQALIEENAQKEKSLRDKKDEIAETTEKLNAATEKRYEAAKENANNDAIKRGIARSSIISELLKEYDKEKLKTTENRYSDAQKRISEIDDEIDGLSRDLNASLKKFDMEKAIEINDRLEELKAEREKKNKEAIEFNNRVKQDMLKYAEKLKEAAGENEYEKQADEYKTKIAFALTDYYAGLGKSEALKDFEKSGYEKLLTPAGSKMVKNYIKTLP